MYALSMMMINVFKFKCASKYIGKVLNLRKDLVIEKCKSW